MSSSEVYQTPQAIPTDETTSLSVPDVLNPRYSYGGGKIIGELLVINYGRKFFERVVIVRPHNVYGPDMGNEHVIPQLTDRLVALSAAQPDGVLRLPIQGTGRETRSFVFIEDFAEGAHMAFTSGDSPGVYHVGTMDERTIAEVAHLVADCLDRRVEIVEGPRPPGGTFRRCPDTTKVSALGFTPRVPLEEGLARTVRWYSDRL
jgi:nucleoside-diphosphate-sugar epimerase